MERKQLTRVTLVALLAVTPLAAACTSGLADAQSSSKVKAISASDKQTGAQAHPQILEDFGGVYRGAQANYVQSVGRKVAVQSGLADSQNAYTITLLDSPINNAFAVPGGYVYITRQLLGLMNDEAELASVLGHEVGHIAARHSQKRNTQSLLGQLLSVGVGILTGSSELMQVAGQAAQLYTLSYSRTQEYQADDLGIRYLSGSGYDPHAAADMLAALDAQDKLAATANGSSNRAIPSWARTHPMTADRVSRARKTASATGKAAGTGLRNRDTFLTTLDGALYDDDPKQGIIDGRWFRHPDLRLAFQAPQGYAMHNSPQAVSIVGSSGQAQFGGGALGGGLDSYIGQVFRAIGGDSQQLSYSTPRQTTINGIPAATSTARANTQSGPVDVTVTGYRWSDAQAFHIVTIAAAGTGSGPFDSLLRSVQRLSPTEAAAIKPRVIDVVTVKPGDTVASLSGRMAYADYRAERFRVMNALGPNDALRSGQRVKLIVYAAR